MALAAAGVLYAATQAGGNAKPFLDAFGGALVTAAILAVVVDPYIKRRLAVDVANDVLWALLSPDCPPEFQSVVHNIATLDLYTPKHRAVVDFGWVDEARRFLRVRVRSDLTIKNVTRSRSIDPRRDFWVLRSTEHYASVWHHWRLKLPSGFDETLSEQDLGSIVTISPDGRACLDEKSATDTLVEREPTLRPLVVDLQPGEECEREIERSMVRHSVGHIPFFHRNATGRYVLQFRGNALPDLEINVLDHGEPHYLGQVANGYKYESAHAFVPGQMTLLQWKARDDDVGSSTSNERVGPS